MSSKLHVGQWITLDIDSRSAVVCVNVYGDICDREEY
jgi:hypothetical protein